MKKSFMKRALATGLSLAMAFSLAATDVNVASAAAKPAMKKASFTVKYGGKTKTYKAKPATVKNYKITKAESNKANIATAKKKNAKAITVSPGTKKKGGKCKIAITFKSRKKNKQGKYDKKTIKVDCILKPKAEEQKPEDPVVVEKLAVTVEATGVQVIKATLNKAVGSDAKITLTKGTSEVPNTPVLAEDGKSATITLTGKLTAGTYTVTVVAAEETATGEVTVEDEKLTKFKVGAALKETDRNGTTASAVLSYEALNQYDERINYMPDEKSVTVVPGTVVTTAIKPCKAAQAGEIEVTDIPITNAIRGQSTFTVIMTDMVNYSGVTLNETVPYGAPATAKEFNFAGSYNTAKSTFKDIADGDKIADYKLLFTCKDQYGDDMDAEKVATAASGSEIQVIVIGGMTGIELDSTQIKKEGNTLEVDGVTYFAVPLSAMTNAEDGSKANPGSYTVQITNNTQGLVFTGEYTVTSGTVIDSVQISQKDTIYADQENEFDFIVKSDDGKEITDYATLSGIEIEGATGSKDKFTWKKNSDGTARLTYTPAKFEGTIDVAKPYKNTDIRLCTIKANKQTSGKYLIKSQTFTVYYQRVPFSVDKLAAGATTVATGTKEITVKLKDLVILDQYQNPYTADELKEDDGKIANVVIAKQVAPASAAAVSVGGVKLTGVASMGAIGTTGVAISIGNETKEQKISFVVSNGAVATISKADPVACDKGDTSNGFANGYTATFKKGDASSVTGLYIDSVNGGCPLYADGQNKPTLILAENDDATKADPKAGYIVVKGKINGQPVTIESQNCTLIGATNDVLSLDGVQGYNQAGKVITETREFTVAVDTADGTQTVTGQIEVSNEPATAKTISVNSGAAKAYTVSGKAAEFAYATADGLFTTKSQYGTVVTGCAIVSYTVESAVVSGSQVTYNGKPYTTDIPASVITAKLDGTSKATLKLSSDVTGPATGGAIKATVVVEGKVAGSASDPVKKTITVDFTW